MLGEDGTESAPVVQRRFVVQANWAGRWIGIASADSRSAPMPTDWSFARSSRRFRVEGWQCGTMLREGALVATRGGEDSWQLHSKRGSSSLPEPCDFAGAVLDVAAGAGWELEEDAGKAWHTDEKHQLMVGAGGDGVGPQRVVAIGRNAYGPFVSAGFLACAGDAAGRGSYRLVLGRRYLDEADVRAEWTLAQLDVAVLAGLGSCSEARPWRTTALHAAKCAGSVGRKRPRAGAEPEAPPFGPAPPLRIPPGAEPSALSLRLDTGKFSTRVVAAMAWEGQCFGCGGLAQGLAARSLKLRVMTWSHEGPEDDFLKAEFCAPACARAAAPHIARVCAEWRQAPASAGQFVRCCDPPCAAGGGGGDPMEGGGGAETFWSALRGAGALRAMEQAGWADGGDEEWTLDGWRSDGECGSDSDEQHSGHALGWVPTVRLIRHADE